ncbi:MAG: hypothetical protein ACOY9D_08220 [Pseudomonadota bacterium]
MKYSVLVAALLALSLSACGEKAATSEAPAATESAAPAAPATTEAAAPAADDAMKK